MADFTKQAEGPQKRNDKIVTIVPILQSFCCQAQHREHQLWKGLSGWFKSTLWNSRKKTCIAAPTEILAALQRKRGLL